MTESKKGLRRHRSKEEWLVLVSKQKGSGMNVNDFCRGEGISDVSFYAWRKRFSGSEFGAESTFSRIEIKSEAELAGLGLRIHLPGGLELHFTELPSIEWIMDLSKGMLSR